MSVKKITKQRFDALCRVRRPSTAYVSREVAWFADDAERVIGIVLQDLSDKDWVWMVLGRDEAGLFRAIDLGVSIPTKKEAQRLLLLKLEEYSKTRRKVFRQGDVKNDSMNIFAPAVVKSAQHPVFRILVRGKAHSAARGIMRELARPFVDVDGNFVKDFQSTGFNPRLWELYLSAFLSEQRFALCRDFNRPDFCAEKDGFPVGIEAVTVNPTVGEPTPKPKSDSELGPLREHYMAIKFGSALYSKFNPKDKGKEKVKYWELDHMKGMPFVLAVHDFCGDDSMVWSMPALDDYLYGLRGTWTKDDNGKLIVTETPIIEHRWKDKKIPSGFFNLPGAENISAVLFSNSATISKFNRMGKLAGFGDPSVLMVRRGIQHDFAENATEPIGFSVEVDPSKYGESWTEGVQVFHNPNALLPIPPGVFEGCANHFLDDGRRVHLLPDPFIHSSHTIILVPKRTRAKKAKVT
jgi:hypothetical protein